MQRFIQLFDRFAGLTGALIAPLTFVMVIVTCVVVIARYLFDRGAVPLQEAVIYMHGMVFMLGAGYTLRENGHVRVDIIYHRLSSRQRASVDLFGTIVFLLPFCAFVLWTSLDYVALSLRMREGSAEPGGLPGVYVLKALIPLMAVLLFVQGIAEILRNFQRLMTKHG